MHPVHFWPKKNGKLEEGSYQVATFHLWNQRFLTQKCVNTAFLSQKWVNTAFLSRKWVNTAFLSRKWGNTAFLSRKWVNTAFFVAKFCKYALIDSFQGYPAVVDSSASCAALPLWLLLLLTLFPLLPNLCNLFSYNKSHTTIFLFHFAFLIKLALMLSHYLSERLE